MKVILKNKSDQERPRRDGSVGVTIDVALTEHPITNPREWTELPKTYEGKVDQMQSKGFNPNDESRKYHVIIRPGESMAFGEGEEFNLEHAEYIYREFGSPKYSDLRGELNLNYLVEVDEQGNEVDGHFFKLYRDNSAKLGVR